MSSKIPRQPNGRIARFERKVEALVDRRPGNTIPAGDLFEGISTQFLQASIAWGATIGAFAGAISARAAKEGNAPKAAIAAFFAGTSVGGVATMSAVLANRNQHANDDITAGAEIIAFRAAKTKQPMLPGR